MVSPEIPRLSRGEMQTLKLSDRISVVKYRFPGPHKPLPPKIDMHSGQSYDLLLRTSESVQKALQKDMTWITSIALQGPESDLKPEWGGQMMASARADGTAQGPATKFVFGPLIDMPPAHPDTVLTTLMFVDKAVGGNRDLHLSADMQLYKIILQIKWSNPIHWRHLTVRPGGMHTLMSFIGCIGTLMDATGLENVLGAAFKGVQNMLCGKAWPKALRGLRMVVTALLQPMVLSGKVTMEAISEELEVARLSRTGRLWVDCLIIPVGIAHLFLRAEREGDWLLHLYALKRMLPYFFAAAHWNYARYILWHVLDLSQSLPENILEAFLRGEHVCRHNSGTWNAVFLDQFGEQTYIRYGKAKGGLVGKSLSSEQVSEWVLSHHVCNSLSLAMDNMFDDKENNLTGSQNSSHREEGEPRMQLDADDRRKIINELQKHTNPLSTQSGDVLYNIVNGRVAEKCVNVDQAVSIGDKMITEYTARLPEGFHDSLKKNVTTMTSLKKRAKIGDVSVYDMEKLYARLLVISQNREIELSDLFKFELAPMPPALFDEFGDMRKGSKSVLVNKLAVLAEVQQPMVDALLVDGNEAIYHTVWPRSSTVLEFGRSLVEPFAATQDTFVIFDCYNEVSIKSHERQRRAKGIVPRVYDLKNDTILPTKETVMKSDHNKKSLIQFLCSMEHGKDHLHLIGDECPYSHEEADVTLITYLLNLYHDKRHIQILADDTDIFVLLVYFYWLVRPSAHVTMRKYDGKVIDIKETAIKLGDKCLDLLAMHALSGCDTVSYPFEKGKLTAINLLLKSKLQLHAFVDPNTEVEEWLAEGIGFIKCLYGGSTSPTTADLRFFIFKNKKEPPKLKCLPPTDDSAIQHVKRARLQVMLWRAADQMSPPHLDLTDYGWKIDKDLPVPVACTTDAIAPASVLQSVACGCKAASPCSSQRCSCQANMLSCTSYCKCDAADNCKNKYTRLPYRVETQNNEDSSDGGESD